MTPTQVLALLAVLAVAGGVVVLVRTARRQEASLDEESLKPRRPNLDKRLYVGMVLSDYAGSRYAPDNGATKGWISGPSTAVVCDHSNPRPGRPIHTYSDQGTKVERTILAVDRSLGHDIAVVSVDPPWPYFATAFDLATEPPSEWYVTHLDGRKTARRAVGDPAGSLLLRADDEGVERLLIPGESGLPWFHEGRLVGHTWHGGAGDGPNYALLRQQILDAIASLETAPQ